MIKHQTTMSNWSGDGTTWIWYAGLETELEDLRIRALAEYGADKLEVGVPDRYDNNSRRDTAQFKLAFVFKQRDDAMRFKLSN